MEGKSKWAAAMWIAAGFYVLGDALSLAASHWNAIPVLILGEPQFWVELIGDILRGIAFNVAMLLGLGVLIDRVDRIKL